MKRPSLITPLLILVSLLCLLPACVTDLEEVSPLGFSQKMTVLPFFVKDESGNQPLDSQGKIYTKHNENPITAPNGDHIKWGEFMSISGNAHANCTENGTLIDLTAYGLVPNGIYSLWNVIANAPGIDAGYEGYNIIGKGAAGRGDGLDNVFTASPEGKAQITLLSPSGSLSMFGEIEDCALTTPSVWYVVGCYHIDGKTYGKTQGPVGQSVEQFAFKLTEQNL